jgi:hypothetical protein
MLLLLQWCKGVSLTPTGDRISDFNTLLSIRRESLAASMPLRAVVGDSKACTIGGSLWSVVVLFNGLSGENRAPVLVFALELFPPSTVAFLTAQEESRGLDAALFATVSISGWSLCPRHFVMGGVQRSLLSKGPSHSSQPSEEGDVSMCSPPKGECIVSSDTLGEDAVDAVFCSE